MKEMVVIVLISISDEKDSLFYALHYLLYVMFEWS